MFDPRSTWSRIRQRAFLAIAMASPVVFVCAVVGRAASTRTSARGVAAAAVLSVAPGPGPGARAPAPAEPTKTGPITLDPVSIRPAPRPLDGLAPAAIAELLRRHPERLGPVSVGRPNQGRLLNGVALASSEAIHVVNPLRSFGTAVTVESIEAAVAEVRARFPETPPLEVGDLSQRGGGYIRPHRSHQTGLDVDLGYYYQVPSRWYTKAHAENLDRPRTWALVKAFVARGNVEYVFMDQSVQRLLQQHAVSIGESRELLAMLFEGDAACPALIRHTWGHLTHFHVRFLDPAAERAGELVAPQQMPVRKRPPPRRPRPQKPKKAAR